LRDWLAGQRTYCRCINPYQGLAHPKLVRGVAPCVTSFSGTSPLRTSRPCQSVQLRLQQGSWLSGGNVTLDAQGNANAVFIFQIGSTLTTITSTQVVLAGGAQAKNIFWQVGSSATLGTNSIFRGNILALTSITITTGVNLEGRALAQTGAVTLDSDVITGCSCP